MTYQNTEITTPTQAFMADFQGQAFKSPDESFDHTYILGATVNLKQQFADIIYVESVLVPSKIRQGDRLINFAMSEITHLADQHGVKLNFDAVVSTGSHTLSRKRAEKWGFESTGTHSMARQPKSLS